MDFGTVLYESSGRVATITLSRPERFNAINETMPEEIASAFDYASKDDSVHVVVLTGAGRGFCGGYDLKEFAENTGDNPGIQEMPWDPMIDYNFMSRCTQNFMSIWRCNKPVIGKVNGDAVAGGSDIALCCDIIIMNEKARVILPHVSGVAPLQPCGFIDWGLKKLNLCFLQETWFQGKNRRNGVGFPIGTSQRTG